MANTAYSIAEIILGLVLIIYGLYYGFVMKPEKAITKNRKYITSASTEEKAQILEKFKNGQKRVGILFPILGLLFILKQLFFGN